MATEKQDPRVRIWVEAKKLIVGQTYILNCTMIHTNGVDRSLNTEWALSSKSVIFSGENAREKTEESGDYNLATFSLYIPKQEICGVRQVNITPIAEVAEIKILIFAGMELWQDVTMLLK